MEEEAATRKGRASSSTARRLDAIVIGEPSGWDRLTVGYKGRLLVDYTLEMDTGHTAGPEAGACDAAFAFWAAARAHATAHNAAHPRMFDQLSSDPARDALGTTTASSTLPSSPWASRLLPGLDADALQATLTGLADPARLRSRGCEPAYRADKNTPLARAFLRAIDAEGGRAQFGVKSGTSDMNVVGATWSCPARLWPRRFAPRPHTPRAYRPGRVPPRHCRPHPCPFDPMTMLTLQPHFHRSPSP